MHPFGGTQICPRCSKAVYLAEQVMGPGRKLYHKPCLACTMCNKRLDSLTLLEHNEQPYCKSCHLKSFGTRDLRHANLPYAHPPPEDAANPSTSPTSPNFRGVFVPLRPINTGSGAPRATSPLPRLRPNRSLATSPISSSFPRGPSPTVQAFQTPNNGTTPGTNAKVTSDPKATDEDDAPPSTEDSEETEVHNALVLDMANGSNTNMNAVPVETERAEDDEENRAVLPEPNTTASPYLSNTGRPGIGTIPRTVPLYLNGHNSSISAQRTPYKQQHHFSQSLSSISSGSSPPPSASSNLSKEAEDIPSHPHSEHTYGSFSGLGGASANPSSSTPLGRSNTTTATSPRPGAFGNLSPISPTATGSRYGIALGGSVGVQMTGSSGTPRKWGAGTPQCPRCAKSVYFAEQVKAAGKTYHKHCLRCVECNTTLDSSRLRDHDGDPFCVRCYGKLHGPQGSGYALLGKAGG